MFPDVLAVLQKAVTGRSGCVLSSPTVILSCDPDCLTLHWAVVRDTAVPTLQTLLILCSTALQVYKDSLVLMQQKATEKIKHICTRNTPTGGQRQIHSPPPHSVCVLTLFLSAWDFYCTYFSTVLDPVSLCELQRGIGCSLCTISWWRYWLAVEQDKLCSASAARYGPFCVREH